MTAIATEASQTDVLPPDFADLLAAQRRLNGYARRTPLLESSRLNEAAGRRILVKAECLQHCGTFKFRGAWNHLRAHAEEARQRGAVAISSGNHAQGVARAASLLQIRATIVMPSDAPAPKLHGTRAYGAKVVTYDRQTESSEIVTGRILAETGAVFVRPYDDPYIIAGQGTTGLEIVEDARKLGVERADVLVPCSGGGLAAGCALAFAAEAPRLRVRPVEPVGFDDWARSLRAGEPVANNQNSGSLCDGLLAQTPGRITWQIGREQFGSGLKAGDEDALDAMAVALRLLRLVLEPSGSVGLAVALQVEKGISDPVIVVASGGNAAPDILRRSLGQ